MKYELQHRKCTAQNNVKVFVLNCDPTILMLATVNSEIVSWKEGGTFMCTVQRLFLIFSCICVNNTYFWCTLDLKQCKLQDLCSA